MEEIITFKINGKRYSMTRDEIYAAYCYQRDEYMLQDALANFNDWLTGGDCDVTDSDKEYCKSEYGISYEEATSEDSLWEFVAEFEKCHDCSVDEYDTWNWCIGKVIEEKMRKVS